MTTKRISKKAPLTGTYVIDATVTELNFGVKSDLGDHNGLRVDTRVISRLLISNLMSVLTFEAVIAYEGLPKWSSLWSGRQVRLNQKRC